MFKTEQSLVSGEVEKLLTEWAIKEVEEDPSQFLSELFLGPRKDGSQRPVVNLKQLNHFIRKQRFKMEGAKAITDLLQLGDWMLSINPIYQLQSLRSTDTTSDSGPYSISSACRLASAVPHECSPNWDKSVFSTQVILQWWSQELQKWNGRPIQPPPPDLTIETDASLLGWGVVADGVSMGGCGQRMNARIS